MVTGANEVARATRQGDAAEAVLQAAMQLFAQKGFAATTTRQIASQAGVNEVTLFRHFRSKADLFQQILEEIRRIYPPLMVLDDLSRTGPSEAVHEFCRLILRRMRESPHLVRLLLYAMLEEVNALREPLVEDRMRGYRDLLSHAFSRLQAEGCSDAEIPPQTLARLLISQVFGLGLMSLMRLEAFDLCEEERLATEICGQFIRGLPPAPSTAAAGE